MTQSESNEILNALRTIKDPELGLDLVTLGLIYETKRQGTEAFVRLTLTTPGCPLISTIIEDVRAALRRIHGIEQVQVELTFDPPWTPDAMSDEARELLGFPSRTGAGL